MKNNISLIKYNLKFVFNVNFNGNMQVSVLGKGLCEGLRLGFQVQFSY
jgi:hypothetical protein